MFSFFHSCDLLLLRWDWLVDLCLPISPSPVTTTVASINSQPNGNLFNFDDWNCQASRKNTTSWRRSREKNSSQIQIQIQIQRNFAITLMVAQNKHHSIVVVLYSIWFWFRSCFFLDSSEMRQQTKQDFSISPAHKKAATKTHSMDSIRFSLTRK